MKHCISLLLGAILALAVSTAATASDKILFSTFNYTPDYSLSSSSLSTIPAYGGIATPVISWDPADLTALQIGSTVNPRWSQSGKKILFRASDPSITNHFEDLFVLPAAGGTPINITQNVTAITGLLTGGAWSPDDKKVVFAGDTPTYTTEIFTVSAEGTGSGRQLTNDQDGGSKFFPVYSPNGASIAYIWESEGTYKLAVLPATGGKARVLDKNLRKGSTLSWSPDGKFITYAKFDATGTYTDILTVDVKGGRKRNLTNGAFAGAGNPSWAGTVMYPAYSPNGAEIAFAYVNPAQAGNEPGELFVIHASGGTANRLATDVAVYGLETGISWSDNGSHIIYPYMVQDTLGNRRAGIATVTLTHQILPLTDLLWSDVQHPSYN